MEEMARVDLAKRASAAQTLAKLFASQRLESKTPLFDTVTTPTTQSTATLTPLSMLTLREVDFPRSRRRLRSLDGRLLPSFRAPSPPRASLDPNLNVEQALAVRPGVAPDAARRSCPRQRDPRTAAASVRGGVPECRRPFCPQGARSPWCSRRPRHRVPGYVPFVLMENSNQTGKVGII